MDLEQALKELAGFLNKKHDDCDHCKCGCPTDNSFELVASKYADRSANTAAESQQAFAMAMASFNARVAAGDITRPTA